MAAGVLLYFCGVYLQPPVAQTQGRQEPGRSIGAIRTQENLIVMTLDEGVLGKANMFDLVGRTLRFTPEGTGYRAENVALKWDPEHPIALRYCRILIGQFLGSRDRGDWVSAVQKGKSVELSGEGVDMDEHTKAGLKALGYAN